MATKINQKDYLKNLFSKKKKSKHKSKEERKTTVKIIDDDIDVSTVVEENDELLLIGEDAPQIVGIIDERPPELRAMENYHNSGKWKKITQSANGENQKESEKLDKLNPPRQKKSRSQTPKQQKPTNDTSDLDLDSVNINNQRNRSRSSDLSPVRKSKNKREPSPDLSPARSKTDWRKRSKSSDLSPKRRYSSDLSPIRKNYYKKERSQSSDLSSKRKRKNEETKQKNSSYFSPDRKKKYKSPDLSPVRKGDSSRTHKKRPRKRSHSLDLSPVRKIENLDKKEYYDKSPSCEPSSKQKNISSNEIKKIEKTLDGKKAGLQSAKTLREESDRLRKKEEEVFKKMSKEMAGRDATDIVIRDKKNRIKSKEQIEKEIEREKRENKKQEIYSRWGVGLKQIEDYKQKLSDDVHEMNKPLARYSNDTDLEEALKKQERDGDPMLAYIKEKQRTKNGAEKIPIKPLYKGSYPENRFNIRPGYRWDGVDRSNGYEKKWFEAQSQKRAREEEAYKYSIEDM